MVTYSSKTNGRRLSGLWVVIAVAFVGLATLFGSGLTAKADATNGTFQFSTTGATVTEGQPVCIGVTRTGGTTGTVNVVYSISPGGSGPTLGGFTASDLTFNNNIASRTLDFSTAGSCITTTDDLVTNGTRVITFTLTGFDGSPIGVLGTQKTFTLNVLDNDGPPTYGFSATTYSFSEAAGTVSVPVVRSGAAGTAQSVHCIITVGSGGATADGSDVTGTTLDQTLSFAIGVTTQNCLLHIVDDATVEGNETVNFSFSTPVGGWTAGANSTAVATIVDNDGPGTVQFSASTFSVNESAGTASVGVTRVAGSVGAGSVNCSTTAGGTATAGVDYTTVTTQSLIWSDGDSATKQCTIPILPDTLVEGPETVNLLLSGQTGIGLGAQSTAVLTIVDDDGTGVIQFTSATFSAAENGGSALITLQRTGGVAGAVNVDCVTIAGGTATANVDFTSGAYTAFFADSVSTATCSIPITDDVLSEGPETVFLQLQNVTGGAVIGAQSTSTLTIIDNETGGPVVTGLSPTFGPTAGGTPVLITGSGFTGATAVHFGLVSAAFLVNGPNSISVTAPAQAAGLVDVTVTTPVSTSTNTANDNYTYTDGPTITLVDPATGPASGEPATLVAITGANFIAGGAGMTVKFGDTATTNFTVPDTNTINVVAPAHAAGTVDIVVTTPGGASPIGVADEFTYTGSSAPVVTGVSPNSGTAGTTIVTISGSGFTGVTCPGGITFGGVSAANDGSCVVNSDSTITARVPVNAPGGTIDVRVTGPGGQSLNTSADDFTNTASQATYTYTLNFRFTLIGWAGPDNTPVLNALQGNSAQVEAAAVPNSIYSSVTAIWTYDTASQSYKGYFPGSENIPGANDFTVFHKGVGYFIAISVQTIQWTVISD